MLRNGTVHEVKKEKTLVKSLKKIIHLYTNCALNIESMLMDREFEPLQGELNTILNIAATDEHVPEIERRN